MSSVETSSFVGFVAACTKTARRCFVHSSQLGNQKVENGFTCWERENTMSRGYAKFTEALQQTFFIYNASSNAIEQQTADLGLLLLKPRFLERLESMNFWRTQNALHRFFLFTKKKSYSWIVTKGLTKSVQTRRNSWENETITFPVGAEEFRHSTFWSVSSEVNKSHDKVRIHSSNPKGRHKQLAAMYAGAAEVIDSKITTV